MTDANGHLFDEAIHDTMTRARLDGDCLILEVSGSPHDTGFGRVRDLILDTMDSNQWRIAVVDLSRADRSCSFLKQALVLADRKARSAERGFAAIVVPGSAVEESLRLSRLDQLVTFAPDLATARQLTGGGLSSTS